MGCGPSSCFPTNPSFHNIGEATRVRKLVQKLLSHGVPGSDITVITFYESQTKMIKSKFIGIGVMAQVKVMTVDSYQGRENAIIILSFVRSNRSKGIGFLKEQNRLNVSISRAKYFLFLVCNLETMKNHESRAWKTFVKHIVDNATFIKSI